MLGCNVTLGVVEKNGLKETKGPLEIDLFSHYSSNQFQNTHFYKASTQKLVEIHSIDVNPSILVVYNPAMFGIKKCFAGHGRRAV